jgi:hypothetical protein
MGTIEVYVFHLAHALKPDLDFRQIATERMAE